MWRATPYILLQYGPARTAADKWAKANPRVKIRDLLATVQYPLYTECGTVLDCALCCSAGCMMPHSPMFHPRRLVYLSLDYRYKQSSKSCNGSESRTSGTARRACVRVGGVVCMPHTEVGYDPHTTTSLHVPPHVQLA